jgi:hypothetical protein
MTAMISSTGGGSDKPQAFVFGRPALVVAGHRHGRTLLARGVEQLFD